MCMSLIQNRIENIRITAKLVEMDRLTFKPDSNLVDHTTLLEGEWTDLLVHQESHVGVTDQIAMLLLVVSQTKLRDIAVLYCDRSTWEIQGVRFVPRPTAGIPPIPLVCPSMSTEPSKTSENGSSLDRLPSSVGNS